METKYIFFFVLINIQTIRAATGDLEIITRKPKEFNDRLFIFKNWILFSDAKIVVGNESIPVHKIILASSSEYFESVFTVDESLTEIKLENMNVEIVQSLIEYCYTGTISVSMKNLHEIMSAATFLKISSIIKGCTNIFEKKMDSSNCISTWKLAKSKNYKKLMNKSFEYIRQNYEKMSSSPEFLDLDYSEILEILGSDIVVTSETIVFNSLKKWVNHDSHSRYFFNRLSDYIKFEYLPKNILRSESVDFCSKFSLIECYVKINRALQQKNKINLESADNNFRDSYSTIMAFGSYSTSQSFEIFNLRNEKWIKIENFKCDKVRYSAVLLEDKVMLIGGKNTKNDAVNTVQSYDLNTGAMENLPPMKYARYYLSAVEFKGRVYAIGGHSDNSHISNVEMWDPVSKIWKEVSSMIIPRYEFQAAVLDEEILVVGGSNEFVGRLSDVESYNPVTDKWRKRVSMNDKRHALGVAVVNGYLYAAGGFSTTGDLKTAEKYYPKTDKWTCIHSLNETRYAMGAANLYGKLVIVGGYTNGLGKQFTMEMYDDENDKWISMPPLNDHRFYLNAVNIPWRLAKATLSREVPK